MAERQLVRNAAAGAAEPRLGGAGQGSSGEAGGMPAQGYNFVEDRTRDGRKFRMLNVVEPRGSPEVDEFT